MREMTTASVLGVVAVRAGDLVAFSDLRRAPLLVHAARAVAAIAGEVAIVTDADAARVRRALNSAGLRNVVVVDVTKPGDLSALADLQAAAAVMVVHDPQCPLVSATDLRRLLERTEHAAQVGVRPVTDTIKSVVQIDDGLQVSATVDRDSFRVVCAPLAVPAGRVSQLRSALGDAWALRPLAELVAWLRGSGSVELVNIAADGLRVEDEDGLWLLECVDDVRHRVRAR